MKSNLRPVGCNVLVAIDVAEEKTKGGIIITDTSREAKEMREMRGEIIALGAGAFAEKSWFGEDDQKPQVGQKVIFEKWAGTLPDQPLEDGRKIRIIKDEQVRAIIQE